MKKISVLVIGLLLMAVNAHATVHCHTPEACAKLKGEVETDLAELLRNVIPKLTEILEDRVTFPKAEKICREMGARLPTARELALVAQSLGARGIRETSYPNRDINSRQVQEEQSLMRAKGYFPVHVLRYEDGPFTAIDFYFNSYGYVRPKDYGDNLFWSSSRDEILTYSKHSGIAGIAYRIYGLNGVTGKFWEVDGGDNDEMNSISSYPLVAGNVLKHAVRCVR